MKPPWSCGFDAPCQDPKRRRREPAGAASTHQGPPAVPPALPVQTNI